MKNRLFVLLTLLSFTGILWAAGKPRMEDIAGKLACYCGTCPHLVVSACGCSTADQIKSDIQKMIDAGQTEDQILQSYIAEHGQTVLAAPTKSGFNLTAWIIPFLAFFAGGAILFSYLTKQRSASRKTPDSEAEPSFDESEAYYRDLLKKELQERK